MFGEKFELNEQTMTIVEEIGRHMPGGLNSFKELNKPVLEIPVIGFFNISNMRGTFDHFQ